MKIEIRKLKEFEIQFAVDFVKMLFEEDGRRNDPDLNFNWPDEESPQYFKDFYNDEENHLLIGAFEDDKIVGYLSAAIDESPSFRPVKRSEIADMFVLPEYRSKGVGKLLVEYFINWTRERNVKKSFVSVYFANDRTINFYKKMGYHHYSLEMENDLN